MEPSTTCASKPPPSGRNNVTPGPSGDNKTKSGSSCNPGPSGHVNLPGPSIDYTTPTTSKKSSTSCAVNPGPSSQANMSGLSNDSNARPGTSNSREPSTSRASKPGSSGHTNNGPSSSNMPGPSGCSNQPGQSSENTPGASVVTPERSSSRLRIKRAALQEIELPASSTQCSSDTSSTQCSSDGGNEKGLSKAAIKMRKYRQKLKDTGKYADYKKKHAEHVKSSRANRTVEQIERDRVLSNERVKKCRKKMKEEGIPLNKPKVLKTRAAQEEKKKYDRERQQRYRASLTPQKKAALRQKRKSKYAEKREKELENLNISVSSSIANASKTDLYDEVLNEQLFGGEPFQDPADPVLHEEMELAEPEAEEMESGEPADRANEEKETNANEERQSGEIGLAETTNESNANEERESGDIAETTTNESNANDERESGDIAETTTNESNANEERESGEIAETTTNESNANEERESGEIAETTTTSSGYKNSDTQYRAYKKAESALPSSPKKRAAVILSIIDKSSPRKRKELHKQGILSKEKRKELEEKKNIYEGFQKTVEGMKKSRKREDLKKKAEWVKVYLRSAGRDKSIEGIRKELKVSWRYLKKVLNHMGDEGEGQKKRKDALQAETVALVESFLKRGDVSRTDPNASSASSKKMESKRYLEKTLKEAHAQFLAENAHVKIGYSKFCSLRPTHVKTATQTKLRNCCCEYCEDIISKRKAMNTFLSSNGYGQRLLGTKFNIADMTCCPADDARHLHHKKCIDRECPNCGVKLFRDKLQDVLDLHKDKPVSWQVWQQQQQTYIDKHGKEVTSSKKVQVAREGSLQDLVQEFEENLRTFAWHLANYQWQHRQYSKLSENLPASVLLMCMDYGENFTCFYQDEAQGAHWTRQQVTLHPIVANYRCPEDCEIVQETFFFISDDLKHDAHAVEHFQKQVVEEILQRGLNITKIVHFSDGCPSQYKGRTSFVDVSFGTAGIQTEKHFFGSRHGKGPCDREIGVVKRMAKLAILRRLCIINSAQGFFEYCTEHLSLPKDRHAHSHKRRCFKFVQSGTIRRDRPERTSGTKGIVGTRKLHQVRGLQPFQVLISERSCFCELCINGKEDDCPNRDFCGKMTPVDLKVRKKARQETRDTEASESEANENGLVEETELTNKDFKFQFSTQGQAVAVYYDNDFFVGQVLNICAPDQADVKFMVQSGKKNVFKWPTTDDIDRIDAKYVIDSDFQLMIKNRLWSVEEDRWTPMLQRYQAYKDMFA